ERVYSWVAGQPRCPEGSAVEKLLMHQLDDPEPVDELRPDVPPGVAVVIRKLMAKSPDHRFQQPAEVADALSALGVTASTKAPGKTMPATSERPISTAIVDVGSAPVAPPTPLSSSQAPTMVQPPGSVFPPISVADTPSQVAAPSGVEEGKKLRVFKGHRGWVMSVAFSPDRNMLASGGVDSSVRLRNFSKSKPKEIVLPQVHQAG